MTYNQKGQPKNSSNSKAISKNINDPDAELKENIRKFKEVCQDYKDDNDELISLILQEFNNNLEDSINGAIMGITKYKSQGSWQKVGGVSKKNKPQPQGNKQQYNNSNYKGNRNNANKDGKQRGNPNYKGNPKDRKNNIQSKPKREPPVKDTPSPSLPEQTQPEAQKQSDSILPQQAQAQAPNIQNQNQNPPQQVFISQPPPQKEFVKHENYASAVKRGVQQQLLAKENSKPPNVSQQAPREEASVPANNNNAPTPVNNSNVSQAPQAASVVQSQPPQQVPQHQPQQSQHQAPQANTPPQKNVEIPEAIPEQRNTVQQNNSVQLPKPQPKQDVSTVNVGISTKNVILPGGLFEDEQVEIQFGKVNTISDKNVDTIKETQANQEENSQDNSQKQVNNPIFSEVNNPVNLEGSHYEQELVPPMIPYPYGMPQNQPYPPYVMDQERGHMAYVDPSYNYPRADGKYNQRNTQYRDNKFPDSSAPNVPQQGSTPQQPTGHPNQHNVYQPFPVFPSHAMYGLPYNPPTSGYPYPRFMYYPGYAGTNVNTGMGYPTEEDYKLYSQGMPNYYPESVPKNQSNKGNQSKNTYQDPSGQPSSGAFKGNQQLNQPTEFKNFRDPSSYYGNINPSFNYPPNPQSIQNTGYPRQP